MKRAVAILCTLFLIAVGLYLADCILLLKRWDGIVPMRSFYAQDRDSIDLLLMGSSNAGVNLDAEVLWTEYGISAYALWGPMQSYWNTYYNLKEALKTQHPKAVVLDAYASKMTGEYLDETRALVNVLGMKQGVNRICSVFLSLPPGKRLPAILGLPIYHGRYGELTQNDFAFFPWSKERKADKGTSVRYGTFGNTDMEYPMAEPLPTSQKQEKWLREIAALCEKKRIQLVLVKTPVTDRRDAAPFYRGAGQLARELDIPYWDFNELDDEIGLTPFDYWTDGDHLNTQGGRKVSRALAEKLKEIVALPDHRGDAGYDTWEQFAEEMQTDYLRQITDIKEYEEERIARPRKMIAVISEEQLPDTFLWTGFEGPGIYVITGNMLKKIEPLRAGFAETVIEGKPITADFSNGTGISVDKKNIYCYKLMDPSIILIPLGREGTVADVVALRRGNDYRMERIFQ